MRVTVRPVTDVLKNQNMALESHRVVDGMHLGPLYKSLSDDAIPAEHFLSANRKTTVSTVGPLQLQSYVLPNISVWEH